AQQRAPASRPRVALACAVGVDLDRLGHRVPDVSRIGFARRLQANCGRIVMAASGGRCMLEKQLTKYLETLREKHPIPLRVRLWNGSTVELDEAPRVELRVKDVGAARYLLN